MRGKLIAAVLCVGELASLAGADVLSVEVIRDLTTPPDPGLAAYILRINTDAPITAYTGTISGLLNQVMASGAWTPTLDECAMLTPEEAANDTHFLLYRSNILVVDAPIESESSLSCRIGFVHDAQTANLDLARIVLREGEQATIVGGAISTTTDPTAQPVYAVIPEPATLGLLAVGGVALIKRRKG